MDVCINYQSAAAVPAPGVSKPHLAATPVWNVISAVAGILSGMARGFRIGWGSCWGGLRSGMKGSRLAADVVSLCGRSVLESGDEIQGIGHVSMSRRLHPLVATIKKNYLDGWINHNSEGGRKLEHQMNPRGTAEGYNLNKKDGELAH